VPYSAAKPSWSPDGSQIAFSNWDNGELEIDTMNADGSNPINVTNRPGDDWHPDWGPAIPSR
jgi:TolB protein